MLGRLDRSTAHLERLEQLLEDQQREHFYELLQLLVFILHARAQIMREEFVERFKSADEMELVLRTCMVQQISARCSLSREWKWEFFNAAALVTPIPGYASAYDFYRDLDAAEYELPLGYYLVHPDPPLDMEAEWVPMEVSPPAVSSLISLY